MSIAPTETYIMYKVEFSQPILAFWEKLNEWLAGSLPNVVGREFYFVRWWIKRGDVSFLPQSLLLIMGIYFCSFTRFSPFLGTLRRVKKTHRKTMIVEFFRKEEVL